MNTLKQLQSTLLKLIDQDPNWLVLFQHHGWRIERDRLASLSSDDFGNELLSTRLMVDRSSREFAEFNPDSESLISPGNPSSSFLYHALASPSVLSVPGGDELVAFPTWAQIEDVENAVFALRKITLADLVEVTKVSLGLPSSADLEFAVGCFALEYRNAGATVHGAFSDLCYSRTGVARVGNKKPCYDGRLRGFKVHTQGDLENEIRVLPSRYAAFVCVRLKGDPNVFGPVKSPINQTNDRSIDFWVPVHKLFNGCDCLVGENIGLSFEPQHFSQKLEKLAELLSTGGFSGYSQKEREQAPFRVSVGLADLGNPADFGSGTIVPSVNPMVAEAQVGGRSAEFKVPPMQSTTGYYGAFAPTLSMVAPNGRRPWPEYAHVRTEVDSKGKPVSISNDPNVVNKALGGNYQALHYTDFAGDGWVLPSLACALTLNGNQLEVLPAYSLVSAPDFFPKVRQRHVYEWFIAASQSDVQKRLPLWWRNLIGNGAWRRIWRRSPEPLSDVRVSANIDLPGSKFSAQDKSVTAIVSQPQPGVSSSRSVADRFFDVMPYAERASHLSDAAAGAFAPGWDTSLSNTNGTDHLAAYGLGSPFPEDAKLCAALSTFWPAAAPDTKRTFFHVPNTSNGTVAPMTDAEIGVGPGAISWDGLQGPRIVQSTATEMLVDYQNYPRADYTRNAEQGLFSIALTAKISLEEYKRRILAMLRCYSAIGRLGNKSSVHVVSFRTAECNDVELDRAQMREGVQLTGPVYRIQGFVEKTVNNKPNVVEQGVEDPNRQQFRVTESWLVYVGQGEGLLIRDRIVGDGSTVQAPWRFLSNE